jgi:hypothetical protein
MNNAEAIAAVVKETVVGHLRPGWTNVPIPAAFTLPGLPPISAAALTAWVSSGITGIVSLAQSYSSSADSGHHDCSQECYIDFYGEKQNCCDTRMLNVRIVALVVVALCAVSIPIKAMFVVRRILSPLKSKATQQTHVMFGVCALMYDVTSLTYGVLKIVDPKKFVIGNPVYANPAIDVVFFLNSSCYVLVLHCIVLNLSHFLLGSLRIIPAQYRDKVSATIDRVEHRAIYAPILGIVLSLFPFSGTLRPRTLTYSTPLTYSAIGVCWCMRCC